MMDENRLSPEREAELRAHAQNEEPATMTRENWLAAEMRRSGRAYVRELLAEIDALRAERDEARAEASLAAVATNFAAARAEGRAEAAEIVEERADYHDSNESMADAMGVEVSAKYHRAHREELNGILDRIRALAASEATR